MCNLGFAVYRVPRTKHAPRKYRVALERAVTAYRVPRNDAVYCAPCRARALAPTHALPYGTVGCVLV